MQRTEELHSAGEEGIAAPPLQARLAGAGAGQPQVQRRIPFDRLEEHVQPLVALQPPDIADVDDLVVGLGEIALVGSEQFGVEAEGDDPDRTAHALDPQDAGDRIAARIGARRVSHRPELDPAKGDREALEDVLRRVEDIGGRLAPQQLKEQHFGDGQGERLLVDVDDIPGLRQQPPQLARVIEEDRRV
ncbi:MAG: hypothetical protein V9G19_26845 [Tetrasphaera sp.]